jgi:hypothetical protein
MANHSLSRRDALRTLAIGGVASTVVSTSPALASAAEIDIAKVPAPVLAAANKLLEGVKWKVAHKVTAKESALYDLEGTANSREVAVEVTAAGKITGIDRHIAPDKVPQVVMKAVTDKFPNFKVGHAEELYEGTDLQKLMDDDLSYEIEGATQKGHDALISLLPDGTITTVKVEVELKAVPKIVRDALDKKAPNFKPVEVHKLEEEGAVGGYLFTGDHKKESTMFVSADGKEVEVYSDE